jgi:hypothetical protein
VVVEEWAGIRKFARRARWQEGDLCDWKHGDRCLPTGVASAKSESEDDYDLSAEPGSAMEHAGLSQSERAYRTVRGRLISLVNSEQHS